MIHEKVNYLSLFGKKMKKSEKMKLKELLKKNKESPNNIIIDSFIDKNGIQKKSDYQLKRDKKMFKSFFEKMYNNKKKKKEAKVAYFSKIKGYKNAEEEKQIKERRKKRFQEIISLKKRRDCLESNKIIHNFSNINNNSNIPYLKKKEYLTDRNIGLKKNNSDLSNLLVPSLPGIDRINNSISLHKKFNSLKARKTNRILNISNEKTNTNTNRTKISILSARDQNYNINHNQIRLFNIKFKKKKFNSLSSNKNKFLQISDKYSKIKNNYNENININNSGIIWNNVKNMSPIKKKIDKNILVSKINAYNLYNKKQIKRCSSSLLIKNNKNMDLNESNDIKKVPTKLCKYQKKWDQKKSLLFHKIVGRYDEHVKKDREILGVRSYFPNYNSIFVDNSKSFVNYGKNKDALLKNLKIDTTRKLITNWHNLIHSPSDSYIVMDIISKEKQKKKEIKINKLKEQFGQYYEISFH